MMPLPSTEQMGFLRVQCNQSRLGTSFWMDMKTLVVGQKVVMQSGIYGREGIVVKVTESCVEVELLRSLGPAGAKNFMRFDTNGRACDSRDINDENMDFDGIPGTIEGGPWELEDTEATH